MSAYENYLNGLQQQDNKRQQLTSSLSEAATTNPDEFASMVKLSRAAGVSVDALPQYRQEAEQAQYLGSVGLQRLWRDAPKTADWLANPDNAKLAKDDVENLSAWERVLQFGKQAGGSLAAAVPATNAALWGVARAGADTLSTLVTNPLMQAGFLPEDPAARAADTFAQMAASQRGYEQRWQGDLSGAGFVERSVLSGVKSLGQNLLAIPASVATGSPAPMLATLTASSGGQAYNQARDQGLSVGQSLPFAASQATIEFATEKIPALWFLRDIKSGVGFAKTLGRQIVAEVPGEQVATVLQDLNEWAVLNPQKPFSDYLSERPGAAAQTLIATIVASGGQVGVTSAAQKAIDKVSGRERMQAEATTTRTTTDQLDALARESKLRARMPEAFREHVANVAGEDANIYVPAAQWNQYFQSQNIDPAQAAAQAGISANDFAEAMAAGADLVMPLADFATHVAGTDAYASLAPHLRLTPGGVSEAELAASGEQDQQQLDGLVQQIGQEQAQAASPQQVYDDVLGQLLATGMERGTAERNATLMQSVFTTLAQRASTDAANLYQQYGLNISRPLPDVLTQRENIDQMDTLLDRLRAGEVPQQQEMFGTPLTDFLRQFGLQDQGGELGGRDLDKNLRAFQRKLVRADGLTLDDAVQKAVQAGYFDGKDQGSVSVSDLLNALLDEEQGTPRYSAAQRNDAAIALAQTLESLGNYLDQSGIDLRTLDNATVKQFLDGGQQPAAVTENGQTVLGQDAISDSIDVDGVARPTTNSNGQRIAQTEEGLRNFWRWFGNSKVVDGDGKPLVVYHGTTADFEAFSKEKIGFANAQTPVNSGFFFAKDRAIAERYAKGDGANIIPAYISIADPVSDIGYITNADGFINSKIVVATAAEQIKSAIGNSGEFDPENQSILHQSDNATRRGRIRFGENRQFNIDLLEKADLSTFLHESGHLYLEVLGDLAQSPQAPQQVRDDYQALLDWFGVESRDQVGVDQHEQFARGFEAYLMEGKAPSQETQALFARFRVWLTAIYRTLTRLNVTLTDDVRRVMDRMVATDEQIAATSEQQGLAPMFTDAASAGMTAAEFSAYQKTVAAAGDAARERLTAQSMAELTREQKAWWKEAREGVLAEVEQEANNQPVYQALAYLQHGKQADGTPLPEGMAAVKLSKAALVERYGAEFLKRLPKPYVYSKEGGADPDAVAELFSFQSGDELVQALAGARNKRELVQAETDGRMRERFGDMLTDGTLAEKAMAAVHNDKQADVMRAELLALRRKQREVRPFVNAAVRDAVGQAKADAAMAARWADAERNTTADQQRQARNDALDSIPSIQIFRDAAAASIAMKRVRDLQPNVYLQAERRASREAFELAAKGKYADAAQAKQRELLNHYLYREAVKAKEEVEKIADLARQYEKPKKRAALGKAGQHFLEAIDELLARYQFTRMSNRQAGLQAARQQFDLAEWRVKMEGAEPGSIDVPDWVVNGQPMPYQLLTVEEVRGVGDAIKNVAHVAGRQNKLLTGAAKADFQDTVDAIVASIAANNQLRDTGLQFQPSKLESLTNMLKNADAWLTKPESMFLALDGDQQGEAWRNLFKPLADAEATEIGMWEAAGKELAAIWDAYTPQERARMHSDRVHIQSIRQSMNKAQLLAVALNWGNAGNRTALMEGYGWSQQQVDEMLGKLDSRDWQTVQRVWDFIDSFWPQIADLQQRLTGLAPEKIEAAPFLAPDGTEMKGGYYPLKYDAKQSYRAFQREESANVTQLFENNVGRASTRKGHTKERVGSGGQPVRLELSVIGEHVHQVIHDLAFREAVLDVNKLTDNTAVREAIEQATSRDMHRALKPWLKRVANDANVEQQSFWERLIGRARMGTTIVNMGWKLSTAFAQPLGFLTSAHYLGTAWAARGLKEFYGTPAKMAKARAFVFERSPMMQTRMESFDRDVRDQLRKLEGKDGKLDPIRRTAFYFTGLMDMGVALPTWLGAYQKKLAETQGDEATAIDFADQTVRVSQSAGSAKDLARIQGGSEYQRMFTMFYSFFSALYQLEKRSISRFADAGVGGMPRFVADQMFLWFVPAVLGELLAGRGPGDDEEWSAWFKKNALSFLTYPVNAVVGLRDIVGAIGSKFGYDISPVGGAFETIVKLGNSGLKTLDEEKELGRSDLKNALDAVGTWAALPSRQAWITGSYLYDVATDEEQPADVMEFLRNMALARQTTPQ